MVNKHECTACPSKAELLHLLQCLLCYQFAPEPGNCHTPKGLMPGCTNKKPSPKKPTPIKQKETQKKTQYEMSEENIKYIVMRALSEGCTRHNVINHIVDGERQRNKLTDIMKEKDGQ